MLSHHRTKNIFYLGFCVMGPKLLKALLFHCATALAISFTIRFSHVAQPVNGGWMLCGIICLDCTSPQMTSISFVAWLCSNVCFSLKWLNKFVASTFSRQSFFCILCKVLCFVGGYWSSSLFTKLSPYTDERLFNMSRLVSLLHAQGNINPWGCHSNNIAIQHFYMM